MNFSPVFNDLSIGIIVFKPEEANAGFLVIGIRKLVEHVLHVYCDSVKVALEIIDYS